MQVLEHSGDMSEFARHPGDFRQTVRQQPCVHLEDVIRTEFTCWLLPARGH